MANKKLTSTVLLFAIGIGFFIFAITHIISARNTEDYVIYSLYLLVSLIAFVALLRLPRKSDKG